MGFALGLGRLVQALDLEKVKLPVIDGAEVFVMYVSDTEKKYALSLIQYLRANGFRVDTEYNGRGLKAQFKRADRLNSKYLIILNDEDLKNDEVKIKNNETKEEELVGIDYLVYYLDEVLTEDEPLNYDLEDDCNCGGHCSCGEHKCGGCHEEE